MRKQLSIINYQLSINTLGFTLVELLVVISVMFVAGLVIVGVLTATLRGATKATVLSNVKQNGENALAQMTKTIRGAKTADILPCGNPSSSVQAITVTSIANTQTTFDCSGSTISVNGTSLLDTSTVQLVPSSCSLVCSQQSSSDAPVVQIKFSLEQAGNGNFADQTATIPFQTSVVLRNVQQ